MQDYKTLDFKLVFGKYIPMTRLTQLNTCTSKWKLYISNLILTTDLNVTSKRNILIPPLCVVDLMQDTEGSFLVYSGADSHVQLSP